MQEELISFKTAKLAKEKGFNWKVNNYLQLKTISGGVFEEHLEESMQDINSDFPLNPLFSRPSQTLLQKWLREVHNIHITIIYDWYLFHVNIMSMQSNVSLESSLTGITPHKFTTYEEALEQGLLAALKLIKEKYEK